MKILYVAVHNGQDNDDEGAIHFALEQLGHQVIRVQEFNAIQQAYQYSKEVDFCLFHKWSDFALMNECAKNCPLVCWFFDKVETPEVMLMDRGNVRVEWMRQITDVCKHVFCTDGDWAAADKSGKTKWLMQGADERKVGLGDANLCHMECPKILFTGTIRHGQTRSDHIQHLEQKWKGAFGAIGTGNPRTRVHGRELANLLAKARVVIAPMGLQTDRYWSNRVFLSSGFGAFLLHPQCLGLENFYTQDEVPMYSSREHLDAMIEVALSPRCDTYREEIRNAALQRTIKDNLYRHRLVKLLEVVKGNL